MRFTYLIEAWKTEVGSDGMYWGGLSLGRKKVTGNPCEARRVDDEGVAHELAELLNEFFPTIVHGVQGKWVAISHGFEGEAHVPYFTEAQIVDDLAERHKGAKDIAQFMEMGRTGQLGMYHHGFGTWIRNNYKLWHKDNPHTMKDYVPEIRDGVDYSPRHPDAVSTRIIEALYAKLARSA